MADLTEAQSNGDAPKVTSHFRPFLNRTRYKIPTTVNALGERLVGSNSNLASLSGSVHNLLDPAKMMSLQEDARSRKISSEVMKRCLYKSVTAPCRRRIANRMSCSNTPHCNSGTSTDKFYSRKMLSLPVTPMQSLRVSPSQSPTEDRQFFYGFLSTGPTPRCTTPVDMDDEAFGINFGENEDDGEDKNCKGLASLFGPQPRNVVARVWSQQDCDDLPGSRGDSNIEGQNYESALPSLRRYRSPNSIIKRKAIDIKAATPI